MTASHASISSSDPSDDASDERPELVEMGEWETRLLEGVTLTDAERARLEGREARRADALDWAELREGLRLETNAHVGLLRLGSMTVRVAPRLAGGARQLPAMIDECAGLDALDRAPGRDVDVPEGDHLLDLVGVRLVEACRQLLRRGLADGYVEREDELGVLRGRLKPREQYLERFGAFDRVHCRFDDRDPDTWENRLAAAGLRACERHAREANLRDEARRLGRRFEGECRPEALDPAYLEGGTYHRHNAHYRPAHTYARLMLRGLGLDGLKGPDTHRVDAFWIDMNRLFEQFVEQMTRDALADEGWHVEAQATESGAIVDARTGESRRDVRPDLVLTSPDHHTRLPVDAKYKPFETQPPMADLRQAALYAQVFDTSQETSRPDAILVYPRAQPGDDVELDRLTVRRSDGQSGADIAILTLPVSELLTWDDAQRWQQVWAPLLHSSEEER